MKTLASVLGIVALMAFMTACGPDMNAINQSTQTAESAATRAQAAAQSADRSASAADTAAQRANQDAVAAQNSVSRANDAVARLEAAFSSSVLK